MKTYCLVIAGLVGLTLAILISANIFWQTDPKQPQHLETTDTSNTPQNPLSVQVTNPAQTSPQVTDSHQPSLSESQIAGSSATEQQKANSPHQRWRRQYANSSNLRESQSEDRERLSTTTGVSRASRLEQSEGVAKSALTEGEGRSRSFATGMDRWRMKKRARRALLAAPDDMENPQNELDTAIALLQEELRELEKQAAENKGSLQENIASQEAIRVLLTEYCEEKAKSQSPAAE